MADHQADSNKLVKSQASSALRRIRRSIDLYVVSTLALSVMGFVLIALFGSWTGPKERWLFGMSLYGCVSAGLMGIARTRILRRSHDATRWARWAIVGALPGSSLIFYIGLTLLYFIGMSILEEGSIDLVTAVFAAIGLVGTGGYVLNGLALARLFRADLDELLWETETERSLVSESLNVLE